MQDSYEFDPCTLDGSDQDDEFVSIDDWKPTPKSQRVPKSEWRQVQNAGNHDIQPGIDEINKIKGYVKKRLPDCQILEAFGITAETLVAIKRDKYCPLDGISLDNQSKIYNKFQEVQKSYDKIFDALAYLGEVLIFAGQGPLAGETPMIYKTMIDYAGIKKRQEKARAAEARRTRGRKVKDKKAANAPEIKILDAKVTVIDDKPKVKKKRVNIIINHHKL